MDSASSPKTLSLRGTNRAGTRRRARSATTRGRRLRTTTSSRAPGRPRRTPAWPPPRPPPGAAVRPRRPPAPPWPPTGRCSRPLHRSEAACLQHGPRRAAGRGSPCAVSAVPRAAPWLRPGTHRGAGRAPGSSAPAPTGVGMSTPRAHPRRLRGLKIDPRHVPRRETPSHPHFENGTPPATASAAAGNTQMVDRPMRADTGYGSAVFPT